MAVMSYGLDIDCGYVCALAFCLPLFNTSTSDRVLACYQPYTRRRRIIRYRATATIRRPQIKQYTASNEEGLQNQREQHIILTKYKAVHPTVVSDNNSSSGIIII